MDVCAGEARRGVEAAAATAGALVGRLQSLSPLAVLARGYAVCWADGHTRIVRSASTLAPGDRIQVTLHEGEISCDVRDVKS